MKKSFLAIALLFSVVMLAIFMSERSPAMEQAKGDDFEEAQKIADEAISHLKRGEFKELFDVLAESSGKQWSNDANMMKANISLREMADLGKPLGEVEFAGREHIGKSYVRFVYLEKFEKSALVWNLVFYKPNDKWLSKGATYNQNSQALFEWARNVDRGSVLHR
jgi:hypothetical protein